MADLTTLVALLAAGGPVTTRATGGAALRALAGQVTSHAAAVAGTLLGRVGTFAVWERHSQIHVRIDDENKLFGINLLT